MTNNATAEGGALVGIKVVTTELATSDPANRVDEVGPVQILEAVLVGIVSIGATIEIVSRRILPTLLITSIL